MDQKLYGLLAARAHQRCECGCAAPVPPGEVDHFFSRGRSDELESTCWVLSPSCHFRKTNSIPSSAHWLGRFIEFCERYNYAESKQRAEARRDFVTARTKLLEDTKARTP